MFTTAPHLLAKRSLQRALTSLSLMVLVSLGAAHARAADQQVVVSNYPLYLLSNAVTQGTPTQAKKLLDAGDVGHHGSLSPKDKKLVHDSKFVVWFGNNLEHNLTNTLADAPNAISLFDMKTAFTRHPMRDVQAKPIAGSEDPHIWLDPDNATAIVRAMAVIHSYANPQYKAQYQQNAQKFAQDLNAVVVAEQNKHPTPRAYWAYHDAFQYLDKSLNLKLAGTLTTDHEIPPKASQFMWLNAHRPIQTMCLLSQSQPSSGMLNKLKPVHYAVQVEDLSDADTFIEAWQQHAQRVDACLSKSR